MGNDQPTQRDLFEQPVRKRDLRDRRAYRLAKKEARLSAGLCVKCGKAPYQQGKQMCPPCLERRRVVTNEGRAKRHPPKPPKPLLTADMKAYRRARRAKRRAGPNCTTCGGVRNVQGCVRCSTCQAKDRADYERIGRARYRQRAPRLNALWKAKRDTWKEQGLCTICGGPRDREGKKCCRKCNSYSLQKVKEAQQRRREAGLCPVCGKRPPAHTKRHCEPCLVASRKANLLSIRRNPEKYLARYHRKRCRLTAASEAFTGRDWLAVKAAQDFCCLMCGRREPEIRLTVDHIIPVVKGGRNGPDCIQGLCDSCNKSKGARSSTDLRHLARWPHLYPVPLVLPDSKDR